MSKSLEELQAVLEHLLGPDGCPWDKKQTFASMRESLLEEAYEVIDAVDRQDSPALLEELGDLFFNVVFYCKLAEKQGLFTAEEALKGITEKLIRRHPHIFGSAEKALDADQALSRWEEAKQQEKAEAKKVKLKPLPALMKAETALKQLPQTEEIQAPLFKNEQELGQLLFAIVKQAKQQGLHAELALNAFLEQEAARHA